MKQVNKRPPHKVMALDTEQSFLAYNPPSWGGGSQGDFRPIQWTLICQTVTLQPTNWKSTDH